MDHKNVNKKICICNQTGDTFERYLNPMDINVPLGYRVEVYARGLDAPVNMVFTEDGDVLIAESGLFTRRPRILRISDGQVDIVAEGFFAPMTGIILPRREECNRNYY